MERDYAENLQCKVQAHQEMTYHDFPLLSFFFVDFIMISFIYDSMRAMVRDYAYYVRSRITKLACDVNVGKPCPHGTPCVWK